MTISIDASASSNFSSSSSDSVSLTTTLTNDIVVVIVGYAINGGGTPPTVSSITDTAGLTWTRRGGASGLTNGHSSVVDVWWAHAASVLTADSITATLSGSIDDGTLVAIAVNGAASLTAPFDTNASLPATGVTSGSLSGVSTTSSEGLLLDAVGTSANNTPTLSSLWTQILSWNNRGAVNFWLGAAGWEAISSALSSSSVTLLSGSASFLAYLDFIPGTLPTAAARVTQAGLEGWISENPAARVTQLGLEIWRSVGNAVPVSMATTLGSRSHLVPKVPAFGTALKLTAASQGKVRSNTPVPAVLLKLLAGSKSKIEVKSPSLGTVLPSLRASGRSKIKANLPTFGTRIQLTVSMQGKVVANLSPGVTILPVLFVVT